MPARHITVHKTRRLGCAHPDLAHLRDEQHIQTFSRWEHAQDTVSIKPSIYHPCNKPNTLILFNFVLTFLISCFPSHPCLDTTKKT